jgi:hypothetical protein
MRVYQAMWLNTWQEEEEEEKTFNFAFTVAL